MKILLTGGGTAGHFYPVIAVAQSLRKIIKEERFVDATIYYMGPSPYDERMLFENNLIYKHCYAGKMRRYFSLKNIPDAFKTGWGAIKATVDIWLIFPDVVFGKGGYTTFPALFAARVLGIPVIIHESDSKPGRVNAWAAKFATRIAVSYESAAQYFPKDKVAFTGNPVRTGILEPIKNGAKEFFAIREENKTILILGGSQGSQKINEVLLDILPELVKSYEVIHQTGRDNFNEVSKTADIILKDSEHKDRYKPFAYLNELSMRMGAGAADVVVSRAGSIIFEIALWHKPSIIIPIPEEVSHDQTSNAFAYSSTGSCEVIEETNLTPHVLSAEIKRILENPDVAGKMIQSTADFARRDAADAIARQIIQIAVAHEK